MKVSFYNLNYQNNLVDNKSLKEIKSLFKKKNFILGDSVNQFEKSFSKFIGTKFAIGTSNGTDALFLAIKALNISKGDEIIIPANTFIATALAVINSGATPILCDVDKDNLLVSNEEIKKKITKKTKAIIIVHLYGACVNISKLKKNIDKKIKIIEDASQAHGAMDLISKKKVGNLSDIACFSLYPSKNLGAYGDSGIITTNNKNLYNKILKLRNWGSKKKYKHDIIGYNMRMDTIHSIMLNNKIKYLNKFNKMRKEIAKKYIRNLKDINQIKIPNFKNDCVYHLFVIMVKKRNDLIKYLSNNGIDSLIHYPNSINRHKCFESYKFYKQKFPASEYISKNILSLPLYPGLEDNKIIYICDKIRQFYS